MRVKVKDNFYLIGLYFYIFADLETLIGYHRDELAGVSDWYSCQ